MSATIWLYGAELRVAQGARPVRESPSASAAAAGELARRLSAELSAPAVTFVVLEGLPDPALPAKRVAMRQAIKTERLGPVLDARALGPRSVRFTDAQLRAAFERGATRVLVLSALPGGALQVRHEAMHEGRRLHASFRLDARLFDRPG